MTKADTIRDRLWPPPRVCERLPGQTLSSATVIEQATASIAAEGYQLHLDSDRILVVFADQAGRRHAHATLAQLRSLFINGALPCLHIEDAPAIPVRGVMLDVSRDRANA